MLDVERFGVFLDASPVSGVEALPWYEDSFVDGIAGLSLRREVEIALIRDG